MSAIRNPGRRRWLASHLAGGVALAAGLHPFAARAQAADPELWRRPRELWITRPQAQEQLRVVYWADGSVQWEGYRQLNRIYRDVIAGQQRPIALGLLNLNYAMQAVLASSVGRRPLVLFSGFRTARTNALVGGVEPNIHFEGIADDAVFDGLDLADNYRLARYYQVGGLGYYPDRGSIHKDIGPRRSWVEFGRAHAARPPGMRRGWRPGDLSAQDARSQP